MPDNTNTEQNAGAAAQQATKTKRDLALERLKTRHPDTEYADDEAIYGAINDDYDADQKSLQGYKDNEKAMADWMGSDPAAATFLQAMKAGKSPYAELIRTHGEDAIDYYSDPDNADEIANAQSEFLKNASDGKKLQEEYDKNMPASYAVFDKLEEKYGEEAVNEAIDQCFQTMNNVVKGIFTEDMITAFIKAKNHDTDVADAAHEGEVRGKNTKHMKNLELRKKGDGTADLDSANAETGKTDNQPELGALGRVTRRGNIWERGNEKRTRIR